MDTMGYDEVESSTTTGNLMDSKTSHLDDLLHCKLEELFQKYSTQVPQHELAKIIVQHEPIDLAYAASHMPIHTRPVIYDALSSYKEKIPFILNADQTTRQRIFRYMSDHDLVALFSRLSTNDAVWLSDDLSQRRFLRLLALLDNQKASHIREMKKHHRNSAGRLMTTEFFSFSKEMTIAEAAEAVRENPRVDFSHGFFILGDEGELQGYVPSRNLIINKPSLKLSQVMRPVYHAVSPDATREEVVDIIERYKISSLPVIDSEDKILGVIVYEDVIEVMEDLADEAFAKIAGTTETLSEKESFFSKIFARAPWLVVTLIAGLINVGIMSYFENREGTILTFVLFFVPLITGMSGNIGIQCSTVLVRNMATGTLSSGNKKEYLTKELLIGIFTGVVFGIFCGTIVFLLDHIIGISTEASPLIVGALVGVGLVGACFAGTFLGVFSPIFFGSIRCRSSYSSGPIVTAFNDILSMTIYFLIAWGLGSVFLG